MFKSCAGGDIYELQVASSKIARMYFSRIGCNLQKLRELGYLTLLKLRFMGCIFFEIYAIHWFLAQVPISNGPISLGHWDILVQLIRFYGILGFFWTSYNPFWTYPSPISVRDASCAPLTLVALASALPMACTPSLSAERTLASFASSASVEERLRGGASIGDAGVGRGVR